jgi:CheY-like chemotaxis protein
MASADRRRVLIIDDEEPMRLVLAQYIQQDIRAEVSLAGTCEAALRLTRNHVYDVILLDLMMPGIGGIELLKRIRAGSANQTTPVVIISILVNAPEADEHMSIERALTLGANAAVPKPVSRRRLMEAVNAQLLPQITVK